MSNKTSLQTNNAKISTNNTELSSILNTINNLPEAGASGGSEDLTSELIAYDTSLTTQETTIQDIISALEGKVAGGGSGNTDIEDSIVDGSITEYTNDRITTIRSYGLAYCTNLTSINLPNVTSISPYAFRANSVLTSINIPKVTLLNTCMFQDCTILNDLDFTNVTQIGSSAFQSCKGLTKLILRNEAMVTLKNTNVFSGTPIAGGTGFVYVPDTLVDTYKSGSNWTTYANQIKGISELE